jgi:hypothetical protein
MTPTPTNDVDAFNVLTVVVGLVGLVATNILMSETPLPDQPDERNILPHLTHDGKPSASSFVERLRVICATS